MGWGCRRGRSPWSSWRSWTPSSRPRWCSPGRGPMDRFPTTRISAVQGVRSPDRGVRERALDTLAAAYWRPVVTYVQLRWRRPREEAEDLAQGFFLRALEKDFFARFDPSRAR